MRLQALSRDLSVKQTTENVLEDFAMSTEGDCNVSMEDGVSALEATGLTKASLKAPTSRANLPLTRNAALDTTNTNTDLIDNTTSNNTMNGNDYEDKAVLGPARCSSDSDRELGGDLIADRPDNWDSDINFADLTRHELSDELFAISDTRAVVSTVGNNEAVNGKGQSEASNTAIGSMGIGSVHSDSAGFDKVDLRPTTTPIQSYQLIPGTWLPRPAYDQPFTSVIPSLTVPANLIGPTRPSSPQWLETSSPLRLVLNVDTQEQDALVYTPRRESRSEREWAKRLDEWKKVTGNEDKAEAKSESGKASHSVQQLAEFSYEEEVDDEEFDEPELDDEEFDADDEADEAKRPPTPNWESSIEAWMEVFGSRLQPHDSPENGNQLFRGNSQQQGEPRGDVSDPNPHAVSFGSTGYRPQPASRIAKYSECRARAPPWAPRSDC